MDTTSTDRRQVGKHLFIFHKNENCHSRSPTIVAKPVEVVEELPREFVKCLKSLFDILDEKGLGLVRLDDIEARWGVNNGNRNGFPVGVIESLKKVAPKNGLLSFERLCTGMKLAMKNREDSSAIKNSNSMRFDLGDKESRDRSQSMPHLINLSFKNSDFNSTEKLINSPQSRKDKGAIMDELRTWQRESLHRKNSPSDTYLIGGHKSCAFAGSSPSEEPVIRAHPVAKVYFVGKEEGTSAQTDAVSSPGSTVNDVSQGRMNTVRSAALTNGVHSAALTNGVHSPANQLDKDARLQQLEDELIVLQKGVELIENARKWYFKRITALQEEKLHLKQLEKYSLEQFQYEVLLHKTRRKELQLEEDSFIRYRSYIQDLNRCLKQVTDNPTQPLVASKTDVNNDKNKCREQELEKELSEKTAKIAQLENEKSALIQKLFHGKPSSSPAQRSSVPAFTDKKSF